jgi:hypothetical protein
MSSVSTTLTKRKMRRKRVTELLVEKTTMRTVDER